MRLIDADELTKDRVENDPVRIAAECAPTAFDKERVKQELEIASKLYRISEKDCEFAIPQNIAFELIEKGGIE